MTENTATPGMEHVSSFFNGAARIGGQIAEGMTHPAARPIVGATMGVFSLVLAFKFLPSILSHFPGMDGDAWYQRGLRGFLSLGLAMVGGMAAFELGNNGFDKSATMRSLTQDFNIAWSMGGDAMNGIKNVAGGVANWATTGWTETPSTAVGDPRLLDSTPRGPGN